MVNSDSIVMKNDGFVSYFARAQAFQHVKPALTLSICVRVNHILREYSFAGVDIIFLHGIKTFRFEVVDPGPLPNGPWAFAVADQHAMHTASSTVVLILSTADIC